jgi:hypothetical protein
MEIKIEWSELSSKQLIDIYDYYYLKASPRTAKKIINKIIYWQENKTITIASVFDCRQNPEKIKKI